MGIFKHGPSDYPSFLLWLLDEVSFGYKPRYIQYKTAIIQVLALGTA